MMLGLMVDPQPPKRPRRQGLIPIVAPEGLPPINILEMARKIVLDVPLLDLMQLSPEFLKALRSMSQRVVVKRPKKDKGKGKIAEAHSVQITLNAAGHITTTNDPTSNIRLFSKRYAAIRPFRVDCIVMTASTKHYVLDNAAQADQGSEMNIISPKLVKQCGLI
ncbi:hypothetical protein CABS01_06775 [Colletotrichum abscissum]|uniref:uncharacterized protein n=1 Tax=Colletotrichum abscissum TaxID=1671311 RepID=UPI0027D565D0|nr:uncharacterized protein CABS01_06775 [Colletotrichum abscissum]KAK1514796.1 hypothetical protein CABS01_06775 [Colletotrichum abscissum]